ncbi:SpoIIE family protein phosphatase [Amycolatopsis sp., V23-08]|uniref:histidine kinase n=1 Tax=Amycolatopsis heterodermiae TaxID=3110235 RepID=A0ABU5RB94_9PSEU|nr:SpoIIE family protein phosphatase [Amycolatopsis sp., V23-08]MEA5363518.1 SpoIIE family protein phosphatase [Amycolatopsis sp., V23-08]
MAGSDDDAFFADGDVGEDLAAVDWAATPLGPPSGWPQSLQTAVDILVSSRFSMWMAWGPDLTFFCNAAYRRDTLGRKYPWALGRPASEVWAEIWDDIGPRITTVLSTGRATWDEGLLLYLERSGYPEESYHTFSYSPLRDDDGVVVGMLCVVREDTDRVIADRRMTTLRDLGSDPAVVRTEQEMLAFAGRQLARNRRDLPFTVTYLFGEDGLARRAGSTGIAAGHPAAPATLAAGDGDAVWPSAGPAAGESVLADLGGAAFAGLPAGDWPEPPTQALLVPLVQQGGAPYGFLVAGLNRYRTLDETYRGFVDLVAGHLAAGIGSARSYHAQQRRAEELAELDRAKTAFFSNISHEFRTPLTLIMGPLEELRARVGATDERTGRELEVIHRNGLRLGKLVNTLLDVSRLEAGRMQARFEPVDLAEVTAELAGVFRSAVDKAGLRLDVGCPPLGDPVYLDRGLWEKVIFNLLSNALKFTFEGAITVTTRADGDQAAVTVADTGIGVPEGELPRLFQRFHRIENARARSTEGSGIGLALAQEIVDLHGGTITAHSVEGEGTTFTIRLPFGAAHLPSDALVPAGGHTTTPDAAAYVQEALRWLPSTPGTPSTPGAGPEPAPTAPTRVLVADDNADMREYLTRLLSDAGYQVDAVTDGQEALEAARTAAFDLVVSDVMMPRLGGLELVAALREDPRTASVPALLLSARAGEEASIEGLRAGADDYLIKPFAAAELLARVRANVELARLRTHQARWRSALVDSLQEAFFVCDADGAVIEINAAFTDILGYRTDGLPYHPVHPWWPDAETDPEGYGAVSEAFATLLGRSHGTYTIPVIHRDGHRLWARAAFSQAQDPDTGKAVIVGTFRDVTAEHYAIQRDGAVASMSTRLAQATTLTDAMAGALSELKDLWRAEAVTAAVFGPGDEPIRIYGDAPVSGEQSRVLGELRHGPLLAPVSGHTWSGTVLEHPHGRLALLITLGDRRPFTDQDGLLLSLLAGHIGPSLNRAHQIDQQRETAVALQRAILGPADLPAGFAVRYEPATRPLEVGGDWYDTVTLADGRIGIVVGDCVGRGLNAAAVMGQLRSACRALLLQDPRPAQTLMALDRFAAKLDGALCTTVFCGVLDPGTGLLTYSTAGHPPGILALSDGTTLLLEGGRSVPLGVRPGRPRPEAEHTIPARATLLLYTDGLVERRRRSLDEGIARAGRVLHDGRVNAVEDLAGELMRSLSPDAGYDDDVALLLYRHPGPLEVSFPAEAGELGHVRRTLRTWLGQVQLDAQQAQNILVAAGEACANAVEHGHRDSPGDLVRLRAEAFADRLRLTVADTGRWKNADAVPNSHRGHGITFMRAMMQEVTINTGATGTTVDMQTRIV